MAKARAEVVCPTCGAKWTWSVDCYNRRMADEWEARHEGEERECAGCYAETRRQLREQERHSNALRAEELVKASGKELAPLVGTEKQVKWAEDIRAQALCEVVSLNGSAKPELVDVLNLERTARWWIDNGRSGGYSAIEKLMNEHRDEVEAIVEAGKEREEAVAGLEPRQEQEKEQLGR